MRKEDPTRLNFSKICRLCLSSKGVMLQIFDPKSSVDSVSLPERIMACSSVKVLLGDGLPSQICHRCICQLEKSYEFKELCESSDCTLRKLLSTQKYQEFNLNEEVVVTTRTRHEKFIPYNEHTNYKGVYQDYKYSPTNSNVDEKYGRNSSVTACNVDIVKVEILDSNSQDLSSSKELIKECKMERSLLSRKKNSFTRPMNKYSMECSRPMYKTSQNVSELPQWDNCSEGVPVGVQHSRSATSGRVFEECLSAEERRTVSEFNSISLWRDCESSQNQSLVLFNKDSIIDFHQKKSTTDDKHHSLRWRQRRKSNEEKVLFTCEVCSKSFTQRFNLRKHAMIHGGEKQYICQKCNKAFLRRDHLVRHLKTHTGEKNFQCNVCNRMFAEKNSVKKHMKLHAENHQPYQRRYPPLSKLIHQQQQMKHDFQQLHPLRHLYEAGFLENKYSEPNMHQRQQIPQPKQTIRLHQKQYKQNVPQQKLPKEQNLGKQSNQNQRLHQFHQQRSQQEGRQSKQVLEKYMNSYENSPAALKIPRLKLQTKKNQRVKEHVKEQIQETYLPLHHTLSKNICNFNVNSMSSEVLS